VPLHHITAAERHALDPRCHYAIHISYAHWNNTTKNKNIKIWTTMKPKLITKIIILKRKIATTTKSSINYYKNNIIIMIIVMVIIVITTLKLGIMIITIIIK
jgi:hypothetical protein